MKKKTVLKRKPAARPAKAAGILSTGEMKSFRIENPKGKTPGVIICDHASNRVPRMLKDMGLPKGDLKKHIAWDIGAEDISRYMARALDMPVILASYSRLVTDLNRAPQYHECMAKESDHIKIPANTNLTKGARDRRLKEVFWPYQQQITKLTDGFLKKKKIPVLIAVHSFTPVMDGFKRPWHIAILWHKEEKIAKQLVRNLRRNSPGILVGENEPYTLFDKRFADSTIDRHGEQRGLPYVFVEFRQDLVDTKAKAEEWAEIFMRALRPILDNSETYAQRKIKPVKK